MRVYSFWAGWTSGATEAAPGPNSGEAAPCWGDGEKVFGNIIMVLMDSIQFGEFIQKSIQKYQERLSVNWRQISRKLSKTLREKNWWKTAIKLKTELKCDKIFLPKGWSKTFLYKHQEMCDRILSFYNLGSTRCRNLLQKRKKNTDCKALIITQKLHSYPEKTTHTFFGFMNSTYTNVNNMGHHHHHHH